jgi:hypothetical protein
MKWQTSTRHKILTAGLIIICLFDVAAFIGWFKGLNGAPEIIATLSGTGGLWSIFVALSVAWEKGKRDKKSL